MKPGGNAGVWVVTGVVTPLIFAGLCILFWFDPANHSFYPTCLFHRATGLLCPGCGSLRAVHQLLHGNLGAAFSFNPFLVSCLPVMILFTALWGVRKIKHQSVSLDLKWVWLFLGAGVAFGILRNLPIGAITLPG